MNTHTITRKAMVLAVAMVSVATMAGCRTGPPKVIWPDDGAPSTTTTAAPSSIRTVDLRNATYPTAACPASYRLPGEMFTLHDGLAGAFPDGPVAPGDTDLGVEFKGAAYGDVNGDGREDVAVHLMCGIARSDGLSDGVAVMELRDGRFSPLASLPNSGVPATGVGLQTNPDGSVSYITIPLEYQLVEDLAITAGTLRVHWFHTSLLGDAVSDGYDVTVTYRIADGEATILTVDRQARPKS